MSRILVIIVTYNGLQWLERCLSSVMSSSVPADVFLFDNGSDDGSADYVRVHFPSVKLVQSDVNLGFSKANIIGLKHALEKGYDFVYLLNQDAWVMQDTFEKLIRAFGKGKWGILSPAQMRPDLQTPDKRFNRHFHGTLDPVNQVQPVRFVMAAHWMISAECLKETGLFSPAFTHYGEDNNYCDRVRYHGFGIGVLSSAVGVHDRQARNMPKERRIYLNCQYSKVRLSDPGSSFLLQAFWQPLRQSAMALRWLSFLPLRNIPELVREYPSLKRWREESRSKGAFISHV